MTAPLKTYSHLAGARRRPSEYEVVSTRLRYHDGRGFEVETPVTAWNARQAEAPAFRGVDWQRFADPRETTYAKYTRLQNAKESFCDGLYASIEESEYDAGLGPEARGLLAVALPPVRFAMHGLQMIAAYVGQAAPEGRVTIAAALQAADEVRRIQRIARRMGQLRRADPGFGADARQRWETDAAWQPLRRVVEQLLVTWDWAEAFVALNLCVKPIVDELFMIELPALARARGDYLLGQVLASLDEDCRWHRQWTEALLRVALDSGGEAREATGAWIRDWTPRAARAPDALAPVLSGAAGVPIDVVTVLRRATELQRTFGLAPAGGAP
jgi:toluene monooxygenase system protein E